MPFVVVVLVVVVVVVVELGGPCPVFCKPPFPIFKYT